MVTMDGSHPSNIFAISSFLPQYHSPPTPKIAKKYNSRFAKHFCSRWFGLTDSSLSTADAKV